MKTQKETLSDKRIQRLRAQGYTHESNEELNALAFGIRFAYRACTTMLLVAILTQSISLFGVMLGIAFLGVILPNHPFDYVYNHLLRGKMNRVKLPARSAQLKFACMIASTWIASVIYLMVSGFSIAGTVMAAALILVALLTATTDFCLPSAIYNALFKTNSNKV